jgi:hypothetical protein
VSAACKNIPYSDEAAKEARTKLFSMLYSLGPPSVFFTISPGDECSFRIKLYLNLKMEFLPQPTDDENALIFDSVFRSKLRIDNPGACARENWKLQNKQIIGKEKLLKKWQKREYWKLHNKQIIGIGKMLKK